MFGSEYGPDSGACTVRGFHTTVPLILGPVQPRVRAVSCVCAADPDKRSACSGAFQAFHNSPRFRHTIYTSRVRGLSYHISLRKFCRWQASSYILIIKQYK